MKVFIYTGGSILADNITEAPQKGELVIAADSGYRNATALGVTVDLLLGDFDSLGEERLSDVPESLEVIRVPCEKDMTDTQLAVDIAVERGATELVIIGGLDSRLDHTLSNLAILENMSARNIPTVMTNGKNRVRYIFSTSTLIPHSKFKYLSLIAKGKKVNGVSVQGCKYPLDNAKLCDTYQWAVSNEIIGNCAFISVKKGGLFIVESCDA